MTITKLTDTQLVLLNAAAQRESGSLLPAPSSITAKPPQLKKAIEGLLTRELIVEQLVTELAEVWREDDGRIGLLLTEAGRAAIDTGESPNGDGPVGAKSEDPDAHQSMTDSGLGRGAKQAKLVVMLARPEGASIDEITAATSWLPHSARAMLTGLRKKGFSVTNEKINGVRRYKAAAPEAQQ